MAPRVRGRARAVDLRGWRCYTFPRQKMTKIYTMWTNMKKRCAGKADRSEWYKHVTVCDEWQDYATFRAWVCEQMRKLPAEVSRRSLSIDRINSAGNYCPANCQIIPHSENATRANLKRWKEWRAAQ